MAISNSFPATHTNWNDLSFISKTLMRMFAAAPVWRFMSFREPPPELLDEVLACAWNRSSFCEQELRTHPEVTVAAIKKLVAEQLEASHLPG